jgi:hypothetical protein
VSSQERRHIFRHGGVGGIRKSELLKSRSGRHRSGIERDFGKKAVGQNRFDFGSVNLNLEGSPNQLGTAAG